VPTIFIVYTIFYPSDIWPRATILLKHEASLLLTAFSVLNCKNPKLRNEKMANLRVFKDVKEVKQNEKKERQKESKKVSFVNLINVLRARGGGKLVC
jgi:hypothetical protein